MSVTRTNFKPCSNMINVETRTVALATPALADPQNTNALVDGEWCVVNGAKKLARATDISTPSDPATLPSYPVWDEKGRTDNQAMGNRGKTILYLGSWEADTSIFVATSMVHNGLVAVQTIAIDGKSYSGLVHNGTLGTPGAGITVGIITRLPAINGGFLRIRGGMHY
jgi:hypothetical protein